MPFIKNISRGLLFVGCCLACLAVAAQDERLPVQVTINGKPIRLIFDTGAEVSVLLPSAAEKLGLQITNTSDIVRPGYVHADWTENFRLTIGNGTNACITQFAVVDIPPVIRLNTSGALAWSTLRQNIIRIDALNHDFDGLDQLPDYVSSWIKFPIATNELRLAWQYQDDQGATKSVLIDTGNDGGVSLTREDWERWIKAHPNAPTSIDSVYAPGAGLVVSEVAWADKIQFGPLVLTGVPIKPANISELNNSTQAASMGLAALKRLNFVVDGRGGFVYLQPKTSPPVPYEHNRIGATFVPDDIQSGGDLKAHVIDGSPASQAGIRDGDVLLKINDLDVTKWRTDPAVMPIGRFWRKPAGTSLQLKLMRGDSEFQTNVVLRNLIGPDVKKAAN